MLDDHYHAIFCTQDSRAVSRILALVHNGTATEWNRADHTPGRRVWYHHWDRCLRTEGDVLSRINYIHRNPVKHGYVTDPGEWPWSSYQFFVEMENSAVSEGLLRFPAPLSLPED